jgi:ABC-type glycerol-3-phosphate transport system substrate-binding protein
MAFLEYITGREAARFWIGDRQSPSDYVPARRSLRDAWIKAHPDTVAAFATSVDDMRFYPEFTMYAGTIARFDQEASARIDGIFRGRMAVGDALAEIEQVGNELLAEKP